MLVVVGGHSRNIGKTSVAAGIIAAVPEARWQAIKITQYGSGVCADEGEDCGCAIEDPMHPYALAEQSQADSTDSGRFLAAGAVRAWWLRTARGDLGHALPALRELLAQNENTIVESNSLLRFIKPDLYLPVLDFSVADMKDSARLFMDRADAFVVVGGEQPQWPGIPERWFQTKPLFRVTPPQYVPPALAAFVREFQKASTVNSTI